MAAHVAPKRVQPVEWRFVCIWALSIAVITMLPYARRLADEEPGWQFTGVFSGLFEDTAQHLSWVRQARDGHVLFEGKFSGADSHGPGFFNLLFLAMGWSARLTGLSVTQIYHLQRAITTVLLLAAAYWFAAQFFPGRWQRRVCLILVSTSGGLYWLNIWEVAPIRWAGGVPLEASTFGSLQSEVIVGPATGLLVVMLVLARRALSASGRRRLVAVALAALAVASVHPHDMVIVFSVVCALGAVKAFTAPAHARWSAWRRLAKVVGVVVLGSAPVLGYHAMVLFGEPAYRLYASEVHAFAGLEGLIGDFGLVLAFAIVGAAVVIAKGERSRALLVVWPAVIVAILATPPGGQRVFLYHGLHLVLCALATRGLWAAGRWLRAHGAFGQPRQTRRTAAVSLGMVLLLASLFSIAKFGEWMQPWPLERLAFITEDEAAAVGYLDDHVGANEVIVSMPTWGQGLPMWTGSRAFVACEHLTLDYEWRARQVDLLMGASGPPTAATIARVLLESNADYVFVEEEARSLGARHAERLLLENGFAERVFRRETTAVYRVRRDAVAEFARLSVGKAAPRRSSRSSTSTTTTRAAPRNHLGVTR